MENVVMETTEKKELVIDRLDILSEKAFALYNKALDDLGTARRGFLPINELRRLGNWLAGGPGSLLDLIDFIYLSCVEDKKPAGDFFSNRLQDHVADKIRGNKHLRPHEVVCRETVFNERSPEEVLLGMGVSKESIEPKLLLQQLDEEILNFLIHPDGEMELCGFCNESMPKFQPVEAFIIKREKNLDADLKIRNLKKRGIEDALFILTNGQKATTGSFVIGRESRSNGCGYQLVAKPFHGHHFYFRRDDEMMIGEVRDNLTKGHLGKARKAAHVQQNNQIVRNSKGGRYKLEPALSRSGAAAKIAIASHKKTALARQDEVSQSTMEKVFPSSKLAGGLGPANKG